MPTTLQTGYGCQVTVNSAISNWNKYSVTIEQDIGSVYLPGPGTNAQFKKGKKITIAVDGYLGGDTAFADLSDVGDDVTSLTLTGAPTDLATTYGGLSITKKSMEQGDEAGTFSLEIQGYFIDTSGGSGTGSGA